MTRSAPVVEVAPIKREDGHFVTDLSDAPEFCPLCGRAVEHRTWTVIGGAVEYRYRCCFGGSRLAWWARRVAITTPKSAHYLWEDHHQYPTATATAAFDRKSGHPL